MSETQKEFNLDSAKISLSELNGVSIRRLADRPNTPSAHGGAGLSSEELKRVFDASAELLAQKHNLLIDEMVKLEGPNSAEAKRRLAEAKRQEYYEGLDKCLEMLEELQDKMIEAGANGSLVLKTALDVYPVGSIYISLNEESPANLFGGTWARIQDRFLMAAGETYGAGTTGGSNKHNHALDNGYAKINMGFIEGFTTEYGIIAQSKEVPQWGGTIRAGSVTNFTYSYDLPDQGTAATTLGGYSNTTTTLPPYLAVYVWQRVA